MSRKVMRLIDPYSGMMECKVCGSVHWASLRRGGFYHRGSWQCNEGCKLPDVKGAAALDAPKPRTTPDEIRAILQRTVEAFRA